MSVRRTFLDTAPGERRGVVTLDGRPERLLIERDGDAPRAGFGAVHAARVRLIDKASALAFLDLGDDLEAVAPAGWATEGLLVEAEIAAEARRGKAAVARLSGKAEGEPRLLRAAPTLRQRLAAWAPVALVEGAPARDVADLAEDQVLAIEHPLPGGGSLAVEPTRALVAIDVDLGAGAGGQASRRVNLAAIDETARLLRLKGLGGLTVIDLVGKGQDGEALAAAAKRAFALDQPGVSIGPVSRFGTLSLSAPWRWAPTAEFLIDADRRSLARAEAQRLIRALERDGAGDPGGRFVAVCPPEVAVALEPLTAALGPRYGVLVEAGLARGASYVRPT